MGIFYLNVRPVTRSVGRRAIAAAAYCSRSKLWDEGLGRAVDFSSASGLVHSEVLLPCGAPERWADRATLWNEVEAFETRGDAQLAMEIEAVVPERVAREEVVGLARQFMEVEFSDRAIDLNVHRAAGADGMQRFYVHALVLMREIGPQGFGVKLERWHGPKELGGWRKLWVQLAEKRLLAARERLLSRTGADATRGRGLDSLFATNRGDVSIENFEIAWRNGERLLAEPGLAIEALTCEAGSFTWSEMAAFVRRNTASDSQSAKALARIESSADLVRLPEDGRFSALRLVMDRVEGDGCSGSDAVRERSAAEDGRGAAQRTLGEALALWEASGLRARGVGLTYETAKAFEKKWGVKSVGLHGLLGRWKKKQDRLQSNDVLVVDEAARLSQRQKEWMLRAVRAAAARLVFVDGERIIEIDGGAVGLDVEQLNVFRG